MKTENRTYCTCLSNPSYGIEPDCPIHGTSADADATTTTGIDFTPTGSRIESITGLRSTPIEPPAGPSFVTQPTVRIIDGGTAMLRPYVQPATADSGCICHLYETFGTVENCPLHGPKPEQIDYSAFPLPGTAPARPEIAPLSLLLAAVALIPTQPTTEQWQTVKQAIQALIPGPESI